MAKVIMICGKLCSGKTTYAKSLQKEGRAVILSIDEVMLAMFGQDAGEKHDELAARAKAYLYQKSLDILETGTDVLLDWGFWTKKERDLAKNFYRAKGAAFEFRYLDVEDSEWHRRVDARNRVVLSGGDGAYYVDEGLMQKFESLFEKPDPTEIDRWIV